MAIKKNMLVVVLIVNFMVTIMAWANEQKTQKEINNFLSEIRCLVCDGESLETSSSVFAKNLRDVISLQFQQGKSESMVREYLRARYGDIILFRPPLRLSTLLLWLSPFLFLLFGFYLLRGIFKRH
ncbi:MAG: cytochrome c-type biogenesis protein [Alphaproteobacteria bacterium]